MENVNRITDRENSEALEKWSGRRTSIAVFTEPPWRQIFDKDNEEPREVRWDEKEPHEAS